MSCMLSLCMQIIVPKLMNEELYDRARKMNMIRKATLLNHSFEYALINPSRGRYGRHRISSNGENYAYVGADVDNYLLSNEAKIGMNLPEQPLCFVFERTLPRVDFADYIGLHEYIETIFNDYIEPRLVLGHDKVHEEACRIELEAVFEKDDDFKLAYSKWCVERAENHSLDDDYFEKAILNFGTFVRKKLLSPLEIMILFKNRLNARREQAQTSLMR